MRRFLSILVIALLGFPSLTLLLSGGDDSRLPACCRRHGQHHCAMADAPGLPADFSPHFQAPPRCPQYPTGPRAVFVRTFALAPAVHSMTTDWAAFSLHPDLPSPPRSASRRRHVDRGPPSLPSA